MARSSAASISLPQDISMEVDRMAKREHKTKSGVIQDALRQYIELRKWRELQTRMSAGARRQKIASDDDIEQIVDEVRS